MKNKAQFLILTLLLAGPLRSPAQAPLVQWHHRDPAADSVMGISTDRAYRELLRGRKATPVVVADLEAVDLSHEDLRRVAWTNLGEVPGNGRDDDHNGYVDDVHGWNFLGGRRAGETLLYDTFEETRLVARLQPRYAGKSRDQVPAAQRAEYDLYQRAHAAYARKLADVQAQTQQLTRMQSQATADIARLKQGLGVSHLDSGLLRRPPTADTALLRRAALLYGPVRRMGFADADAALARLTETIEENLKNRLAHGLNLRDDGRARVVGDRPADLTERHYGSPDVAQANRHGTHTAGLIAADRQNELGGQGVADAVQLMAVNVAPAGDERDKDVANGIRYAVDNGAKIISLSFGKDFSPDRRVVDEAIRYAERRGALLVHAAGNAHQNLDSVAGFPAARYPAGREMTNMLTVGASGPRNGRELVAPFSNYGPHTVDVFAPGVRIMSTVPGNAYDVESGTSMAAPVAAGVAAVLKSYFPRLTPAELKRILVQSARPVHTQVYRPGTRQLVDFATLSRSGGVINLYEAVRLALAQEQAAAARRNP